MDPEEIEQLHEAAVGLYVSGRYSEARKAWEAVLSADSADARAIEGIRMVRVLSGEWPADAPGNRLDPAISLDEELRRIESLLGDARYGDALLAAQRASESDPGNPQARQLAGRALELFEAAPYIDVELSQAHQAVSEGLADDAREACQRILSLDPGHRAAAALLASIEGRAAAPAAGEGRAAGPAFGVATTPPAPVNLPPPSPAPPAPAPGPQAPPPRPAAKDPTPPASAATPAPAPPSPWQAPPPDAFFDITDADLAPETVRAAPSPAAFTPPAPELSHPISEASHHEDAVFDLNDEIEPDAADEKIAVSGLREAVGSGHHSLFEMPDEDVPTIKTTFSELEAEIDETQGTTEGQVEFDISEGADSAAYAPGAASASRTPSPAAEPDDAMDLSFNEEDFALMDAPAIAAAPGAPPAGTSAEARIAALLDESRRALKNARYSEAIEAAARAFAIDPDALGAQQLIDEARTRQDEADREAEETLGASRDQLTAGDLDAAEGGFRKVLEIHPAHREALDGLDQITRRRNESDIKGPGVDAKAAALASGKKAATDASAHAPAEPAWPTSEPLTPKSHAPKSAPVEPAPTRAPRPVSVHPVPAPAAAKSSSGIGRRLMVIGGIVGVLLVLAVIGAFAVSSFLGNSRPVEKAVLVPRHDKREVNKAGKAVTPKRVTAEKTAPDPAQAAIGVPRTLSDAKHLASQGKLEAARAVLADMVRAAPDDIAALDALKGVEGQIVERDQAAESMQRILRAFKQDQYEDALRMLYRLPPEMQRGDVETYKTNAWYNNGISYLLGGNCIEAVRSFDEALSINPHDRGAQRLKAYSKTYNDREKDSAFRAFVDQLEKRPIDAK